MKSTLFLFPAVLFTIVALFASANVIGGLHDLDTLLGLFVFAALALFCWRAWFRARGSNATPDPAPAPGKGLSKKERRKARRERASGAEQR